MLNVHLASLPFCSATIAARTANTREAKAKFIEYLGIPADQLDLDVVVYRPLAEPADYDHNDGSHMIFDGIVAECVCEWHFRPEPDPEDS